MDYEIIVVGGGHAGCEAAMASARKGHKTLLISGNINNIATMPCNPSIGGSAKGIIVREIDALGGSMGEVADATLIQMKMLNYAKGPAVKSLRAQADKITYPKEMLKLLREEPNLTIKEAMVENLIVKDNTVYGVVLEDGTNITSNIVILTTGTYLKSDILIASSLPSSIVIDDLVSFVLPHPVIEPTINVEASNVIIIFFFILHQPALVLKHLEIFGSLLIYFRIMFVCSGREINFRFYNMIK